jgi:hypothetical protein
VVPEWQPWPDEAGMEAANLAPFAGERTEPVPQMASQTAPSGAEREAHETAVEPIPSAETEEGIPFVSEAERMLEQAAAEAPAAQRREPPPALPSPLAVEEVVPVTEQPANPRRGWWQRLTQS